MFKYMSGDQIEQSKIDEKSKEVSKSYKEMDKQFKAYSKAMKKVDEEKKDAERVWVSRDLTPTPLHSLVMQS